MVIFVSGHYILHSFLGLADIVGLPLLIPCGLVTSFSILMDRSSSSSTASTGYSTRDEPQARKKRSNPLVRQFLMVEGLTRNLHATSPCVKNFLGSILALMITTTFFDLVILI